MIQADAQAEGGINSPSLLIFFRRHHSWMISVVAVFVAIIVAICMTFFLTIGNPLDVQINDTLTTTMFGIVAFVINVLLITFFLFRKAWGEKKKHEGEEQLKARGSVSPDKPKEEGKSKEGADTKKSETKKKSPLWVTLLTLWIALALAKWVGEKIFLTYVNVNPDSAVAVRMNGPVVPVPPPCDDRLIREASGEGNYLKKDIPSFTVYPTAGCFGELITPPSIWNTWDKGFISGGDECSIWFQFDGQKPIGPYTRKNLPDFPIGRPTKWRIATNCTFQYVRLT